MRKSYSPSYTCRGKRNSVNDKELLTLRHMQGEKGRVTRNCMNKEELLTFIHM